MRSFKFALLFLIVVFSFQTSSYSQTFGPDRIACSDTTYDVNSTFISVAFNGWVYCGGNYHIIGTGFYGYLVDVSKDNGITWQTFLDFSTNPPYFIRMTDMIVAGSDTNNLHLIIASIGGGANPYSMGYVVTYDAMTGSNLGSLSVGDGWSFLIDNVAICSDWQHPLAGSNPYSVAAVFPQQVNSSGTDSLLFYLSEDGGLTFTGPDLLATTQGIFGKSDIAYGSYKNSMRSGKYDVVWEEDGNIGGIQISIPFYASSYSFLDTAYSNLSGKLSNPMVCMQNADYQNLSGDYSSVVLAEVHDTITATNGIVGFFNNDSQNGGFGFPAIVDTSKGGVMPSVSFNEPTANFIATWRNSATQEFPCVSHNINFPGAWNLLTTNYVDTPFLASTHPTIAANPALNDISVCWIQSDTNPGNPRGVLKYDSSLLPLNISSQQNESSCFITPNPSTGHFQVSISYATGKSILKIFDCMGQLVFEQTATAQKKIEVDMSGEAKGIYYLQMNDGKEMVTLKLVIQ